MRCSQLFLSYALGGLKGQCHEKITTVEHMGCFFMTTTMDPHHDKQGYSLALNLKILKHHPKEIKG